MGIRKGGGAVASLTLMCGTYASPLHVDIGIKQEHFHDRRHLRPCRVHLVLAQLLHQPVPDLPCAVAAEEEDRGGGMDDASLEHTPTWGATYTSAPLLHPSPSSPLDLPGASSSISPSRNNNEKKQRQCRSHGQGKRSGGGGGAQAATCPPHLFQIGPCEAAARWP